MALANVLVYIELSGDRPVEASLEALGEARRLASSLGATLDALVACTKLPDPGPEGDLIELLSALGADRVMVLTAPHLGGPPVYATHGDAVAATCEEERPTLVMFAATPGGRDLGARLAARMGAVFVPEPAFEWGASGDLVLSRPVYGGLFKRRLAIDDLERPVVVTVPPGVHTRERGDEEAEVVMLAATAVDVAPVEEIERRPDGGALEQARVVVCAGAGVGSREGWQLVCELAEELGGEPCATHDACVAGYAPADREVGVGARRVSPRLYLACGASGSPQHLGAVSGDAEIVAIDEDAQAPIFRVAQYGLIGDMHEIVPELLRELRAGKALEAALAGAAADAAAESARAAAARAAQRRAEEELDSRTTGELKRSAALQAALKDNPALRAPVKTETARKPEPPPKPAEPPPRRAEATTKSEMPAAKKGEVPGVRPRKTDTPTSTRKAEPAQEPGAADAGAGADDKTPGPESGEGSTRKPAVQG